MKPKGVVYQIPYSNLKNLGALDGLLTKKQREKKRSCLSKGHGMKLLLSTPQLRRLQRSRKQQKIGGFIFSIPAILAALGAVGSLAGGSAAIAKTVIDSKKNKAELEEQKRHNLAMEKKGGKGVMRKFKKKKQRHSPTETLNL